MKDTTFIIQSLLKTGKRFTRGELAKATELSDRVVRECIRSLRIDYHIPICSQSSPERPGYWLAENRTEYTDFTDYEIRTRIEAITEILTSSAKTVEYWKWD